MGIQGLMKLLHEEAPHSIKEHDGFAPLTGRKIAIDASMAMYQFLVAVRSTGGAGQNMQLTNEAGEVTSHVQGMFNRTIKMMEGGLKPCYVFDGKPPNMKSGELAKRMAKRAKAESDLAAAKEAGEADDIDRFSRRLVKVTKQHNEDCKKLLKLMGVPVVNAPCEAEAQCAELAKAGVVWATATEDMDALTFRTPKLIRKLTFSQSSKDKSQPIIEIDCEKVLSGMDLSYEQFVDLCIMCGCDYCGTIKGIGPKNALKLIREFKNIEAIIAHIEKGKKYDIPSDWKEQRVSKKALLQAERLAAEEKAQEEEDRKQPKEAKEADFSETSVAISVMNAELPEGPGAGPDSHTQNAIENSENVTSDPSTAPFSDANLIQSDNVMKTSSESKNSSVQLESNGQEEEEIADDDLEIIPPLYIQARSLFLQADVTSASLIDVKWEEPNEDGLRQYLIDELGFGAERVNKAIDRLKKAQQKKSQQRMDSFFTLLPSASGSSSASAGTKRKVDDKGKKGTAAKKGSFSKRR